MVVDDNMKRTRETAVVSRDMPPGDFRRNGHELIEWIASAALPSPRCLFLLILFESLVIDGTIFRPRLSLDLNCPVFKRRLAACGD